MAGEVFYLSMTKQQLYIITTVTLWLAALGLVGWGIYGVVMQIP